jgi:hypothetical protein
LIKNLVPPVVGIVLPAGMTFFVTAEVTEAGSTVAVIVLGSMPAAAASACTASARMLELPERDPVTFDMSDDTEFGSRDPPDDLMLPAISIVKEIDVPPTRRRW